MKGMLSKKVIHLLLFMIISAALITGGSFIFIHDTNEDVNGLNKNFLSEIAAQNANVMKRTVQVHLDKVSAIANVIGNEENFSIESAIAILTSESSRSSFKRMGYANLDGNAQTTDGEFFSVAERSYFEKAVVGLNSVSDRLIDKVDGEYINVYAVPLYHQDKIIGVIFATNRNDDYIELLSSETFHGDGFSYVIKENGSLVAYPSEVKGSSADLITLFDNASETGEVKNTIDGMNREKQEEEKGFVKYSWNGIDRVGAYSEVGIEDWYAVTMVPKSVISANTDRIVTRNIAIVVMTSSIYIVFIIFTILQNRKSKKELERIAYFDELTGCLNFNAFKQIAQKKLIENKTISYIFVKFDVENFKFVNNRLGFKIGNEVLKNIAHGLKQILDTNDEAYARIGADEFIIMMKDQNRDFLPKIRDGFVETFNALMGVEFNHLIRFRSGLFIVDKKENDFTSIYEKVNYAHRQSKKLSTEGDIVEFYYNDSVRVEEQRRVDLEDAMLPALKDGSFELFIQPKYELKNETISGGEALVRWRQIDGSLLFPVSFIPLFEENGTIIKLDMYMFEEVCKLLQTWIQTKTPLVCISVNFSRLHLYNANFVDELIEISERYEVPKQYIELELTETIFFENESLLESVLLKAHEVGFTVSMDDFGNGYSSLGLLKNINIDVIKMDRNFFVDDIHEERTNVVVEYVIKMAQKLGVRTLAEGVETKEHIDMLKGFGCDFVQGYYYAKPMPYKAFEEQLQQGIKEEE